MVVKSYPLKIALRYFVARRQNRFASFVSAVSVCGIALGVAVLIVALAVMNGFHHEVLRHVLGMSAHAIVLPASGQYRSWQVAVKSLESDAPLMKR